MKKFFIFFISALFLFLSNPAYSKEFSSLSVEKYINKISTKFSRTYCNTSEFGISNEGALAFAIGETNKEFRNNKLNKFIDYPTLEKNIINKIENNCQVYDFPSNNLEKLKFD